ncbi:hypothetical protein GCM10027296_19300 [Chitinimonas naiadis]
MLLGLLLTVLALGLGLAHWQYRQSPWYLQERAILGALDDPPTAEFRRVHQSPHDAAIYCGEVNPGDAGVGATGFVRYLVRIVPGVPAGRFADPDFLAQMRRSHALRIETPFDAEGDVAAFERTWRQSCMLNASVAS